jgi:hypothetical protein
MIQAVAIAIGEVTDFIWLIVTTAPATLSTGGFCAEA